MIRVAAVGDVHLGADSHGELRPALDMVSTHADVLLLAGDLTRHGGRDEAKVVADEFADLGIPVIAVLGNHDYHSNAVSDITNTLTAQGISVLEGESVTIDIAGQTLGIAGTKGFGGGFAGKCASVFGEPQMKEFAGHTVDVAERFRSAVSSLQADIRVALLHYSPISDTLHGEPPEIYPFLGSYLLGEPIDEFQLDLALHGHAHAGTERGTTPGGVRVRNVAQPVIRAAYAVYGLGCADS
ncbi:MULTISPECIES: metallophosphoesterase [unclassified Rhodococcus (in: high G+C Gram-positive bacteria)]|uniref:metallophosphoesterase family protein n=1 Tax=Rhodococcus TaxID=1827 RepID=UPI0005DFB0CA|nr:MULTISPECIES: metallophosphoesterase [unclassified Rhodococcus (in: high G+C Gram-positive bacteria)]KJF24656.1 phosphodiesterase, family [Rhodococcus sp. AD45]